MIRPIVQILRFYVINRTIGYRTIDSLMRSPNYNPLLKKCVEDAVRHPDWAKDECARLIDELEAGTFKFDSGAWAMDIRDEDVPKGVPMDRADMIAAVRAISDFVDKRDLFSEPPQNYEAVTLLKQRTF